MAAAKDLKLDEDGDLYIDPTTGDLKVDFSDKQHIKDIINSNAGWWKQFPLVGVGIQYYLNGPASAQQLEKNIKIQLQADGYSVDRTRVLFDANGNYIIEPNAVRL